MSVRMSACLRVCVCFCSSLLCCFCALATNAAPMSQEDKKLMRTELQMQIPTSERSTTNSVRARGSAHLNDNAHTEIDKRPVGACE